MKTEYSREERLRFSKEIDEFIEDYLRGEFNLEDISDEDLSSLLEKIRYLNLRGGNDVPTLLDIIKHGAERGLAVAQHLLGYSLNNSALGQEYDEEKAIEYLLLAARQNYRPAQEYFFEAKYLILKEHCEEVIQWAKIAVEEGKVKAMSLLYYIYTNAGDRFLEKANYAEAFKYCKLAVEHQDGTLVYALGHCYQKGLGCDVNIAEAMKLYLSLKYDPRAEYALGEIYEYGAEGVEKNEEQALVYYELAYNDSDEEEEEEAEWKYTEKIAQIYKDGLFGVEPNYDRVSEVIQYAGGALMDYAFFLAEKGYARMQYRLGLHYGQLGDFEKAFEWYKKSAENGYYWGQCNLANYYEEGKGTEQDYKKALKWYHKAAEKGDYVAFYSLAYIYEDGLGEVEVDYFKALTYYKQALLISKKENETEHRGSIAYRLARMYELGRGTEVDLDRAKDLYEYAKEHDCRDAFEKLKGKQ